MLIICDEAQNSYMFDSFWNDFVKLQSQGAKAGPYIAVFPSWGLPSGNAVNYDGSAPPYLLPDQWVSINILYFTHQEFTDVHHICNADKLQLQPFLPGLDLVDYLFKVTSGHPGCTRAIFEVLIHSGVNNTGYSHHNVKAKLISSSNFVSIVKMTGFLIPNLHMLLSMTTVYSFKNQVPSWFWQELASPRGAPKQRSHYFSFATSCALVMSFRVMNGKS